MIHVQWVALFLVSQDISNLCCHPVSKSLCNRNLGLESTRLKPCMGWCNPKGWVVEHQRSGFGTRNLLSEFKSKLTGCQRFRTKCVLAERWGCLRFRDDYNVSYLMVVRDEIYVKFVSGSVRLHKDGHCVASYMDPFLRYFAFASVDLPDGHLSYLYHQCDIQPRNQAEHQIQKHVRRSWTVAHKGKLGCKDKFDRQRDQVATAEAVEKQQFFRPSEGWALRWC